MILSIFNYLYLYKLFYSILIKSGNIDMFLIMKKNNILLIIYIINYLIILIFKLESINQKFVTIIINLFIATIYNFV